jgi:hypothetical protein
MLVDGKLLNYNACIKALIEALEEGIWVTHAYHLGTDCYWIDLEGPWFSKPVFLSDEGLMVNGQVREVFSVPSAS